MQAETDNFYSFGKSVGHLVPRGKGKGKKAQGHFCAETEEAAEVQGRSREGQCYACGDRAHSP